MTKLFTPWSHKFDNFDNGYEEFANMLTHAIGVGLSIAALITMTIVASLYSSTAGLVGGIIFGASLILAYGASTLLHMPWIKAIKMRFLALDQSMIFLLIAGTYTPILLLAFTPAWALGLLALIWVLAITGVVLRLTYFDPDSLVLTGLYLVLGWLGVAFGYWLVLAIGWGTVGLLLAGGLLYTGGVVFYKWRSLIYSHAIWHLLVMAASGFHFAAVLVLMLR